MEWTRSETVALAKHSCTHCYGLGLRLGLRQKSNPCNCVLRAIFRACYARFRQCVAQEKYMSSVSLERIPGREGKMTWGRKDEEYVADFCLVSRKALDDLEYGVFRFHFLLGADWRLCCRRLSIDRGHFFHFVYRIEQKLGRTFRELEPYGLYPIDEYFDSSARREFKMPLRFSSELVRRPPVLQPPLEKTA